MRAVVTKRKRGYAEARTLEVLEPSPERIAPLADHPGAPWQVLPYERQLAVKQEQVNDALTRIGKLEGFELDEIVPAVEQWRYRNKLEYSFGSADDGTLVCGFHAPGSWHEIVPVADCLLASERSNVAREQVLAWCRAQGLEPMDRRTHTGLLRNLVVREGRRTGSLQVRIVTGPGELDTSSLAAAVDCEGPDVDAHRRARREHGRRRHGADRRRARARGGDRWPAPGDLAAGVLSDEHRDGRAPVRDRRRPRRR